jgi:plastocyanin
MRTSFMRRARLFGIGVVAILALGACTGDSGETAGASDNAGGGTVAVVDGVVELTADDLAFSASVIEAPAGEAFTISFTNLEAQPHNVAVFTEEGGDEIVKGEIIDEEGGTDEIEVPALDPGEYYFVCEVHTNMEGTIVVEG